VATKGAELRLPALEIRQGKNRRLYCFAVDGKILPSFTTISRIGRGDDKSIHGYQRPEVLSHIAEIRTYLESEDPLLPNAIVVAFDSRVRFQASKNGHVGAEHSKPGTIIIPIDPLVPDSGKPGWIVDGQQRVAAIREAKVHHFPICIVGFITDDDKEQREQFILVNSTKPLPKGLIYELLPSTDARLPTLLQRRRFPACLLNRLNYDNDSPLKGAICTPTTPGGLIKDNSILKMLENSLSDGVLFRFRNLDSEVADVEGMLKTLKAFWGATAKVFKHAWKLPPRRSRLMHGAGIVSMGFIMDAIADRYRQDGMPEEEQFKADLDALKEVCRWTDGYWEFGPGAQRKWNEIQNTPKDIQLLANYLLVQYKARVWNAGDQKQKQK
jgi:DGQHR domain-containing protein